MSTHNSNQQSNRSIIQSLDYRFIPNVNEIYKHFKGTLYQVVAISFDSETIEPLVTYRSVEGNHYWTRTLRNFTDLVQQDDDSNYLVSRFEKI